MKVICDRQALSEGLAVTAVVIASRTPKPILQCVRLTAQGDCLTLAAYDQEVGVRYHLPEVEVERTGETLVMAERLVGIVRESLDETLALEAQEGLLHVRGRDSHFQIYGQDVREFPPVPEFEGEPDLRVNIVRLAEAIQRTVFAAARETTRYAINGVLWEVKGKTLRLVATDGRRLASAVIEVEKTAGSEQSVTVPLKTMNLLSRLKHGAEDMIDVRFVSNQILLRAPRATVSSVLVEGHFPRYEDVIPHDCDRVAELDTAEFLSAVRRAALLTSEESRGVRLNFQADEVVLSSRAPEQGEAMIRTPVQFKGSDIEIGFNPVYLAEALKVCDESVTLEMKEPTKPGLIKSGADFLYVVMPVTLS